MKRKYNYLERVIILSNTQTKELQIEGLSGTILGHDLIDGRWIYSVDIEGKEELYSIEQESIQSRGTYDDQSKFY
jgi:hypothetical protein